MNIERYWAALVMAVSGGSRVFIGNQKRGIDLIGPIARVIGCAMGRETRC